MVNICSSTPTRVQFQSCKVPQNDLINFLYPEPVWALEGSCGTPSVEDACSSLTPCFGSFCI